MCDKTHTQRLSLAFQSSVHPRCCQKVVAFKFEVQGSPMMAGSCIDLLPLCPLLAEVAGRAGRVGGYRGGRARDGSGTATAN